MTMYATARRLCLRHSTSSPARSVAHANAATGIRTIWPSSATSTRMSPRDLDIHLIVDNYATHKHATVKAWLARRPRYHVHYTPTYASWLNQVERRFGIITQQAIRRGSFSSVPQLRKKINAFVEDYNKSCSPFVWTATAELILAKVERISLLISGLDTKAELAKIACKICQYSHCLVI